MIGNDVITKFEQYVDDTTELSTSQEQDLLQKVFNKVWTAHSWEFTKAATTGSFALTTPNITLPADFSYFAENNQTTDNTVESDNNANPKVIFSGSNYTPIQIVNWSDRRQFRNQTNYAYLDLPNSGISFAWTPTAIDTYEFDYVKKPPTLTFTAEIPGVPSQFHDMLYHLMAIDDEIILHFPRAQSYAAENKIAADDYMADLSLWNANLNAN